MEEKKEETIKSKRLCVIGFARKAVLIISEFVLVVGVIAVIGVCALAWRLLSAPMDVEFAKDYIQEALKQNEQGFAIEMDDLLLYWPDFSSPIMLGSSNIQIRQNDKDVMAVDSFALGLSGWDLAIGKVRPVSITIDGPFLHLIRSGQSDIRLNIISQQSEGEGNTDPEATQELIEDIVWQLSKPIDNKNHNPLAKLERVEINNAKAMIADQYYGISWLVPNADFAFQREHDGMSIISDLRVPTRQKDSEFGELSLDIHYLRDTQDYSIQAEFKGLDAPALSARIVKMNWLRQQDFFIEGSVSVLMNKEFIIREANADFDIPKGVLKREELFEQPLNYNKIGIKASYRRQKNDRETIKLRELLLELPDFTATLSADLERVTSTGEIAGPVTAYIPELNPDKISNYWPKGLEDEAATEWLTENLTGEKYKKASASLDFMALPKPDGDGLDLDVKNIQANFEFEGINIDYRPPLYPIENAVGKGSYINNALKIDVESGNIKGITIHKASANLENIHIVGGGTADIDLSLEGKVGEVFKYISEEPINFGQNANIDIDKVKGDAKVDVNIRFPTTPTLRTEEVEVTVDATVTNGYLPNVLRGMPIVGGPLKVKVNEGMVNVSGKAKLASYPLNFSWERFLDSEGQSYVSTVKAQLTSDEGLRETFGVNLAEIIGDLPLDIHYKEYHKGKADLHVKADITPTRLEISSLGYTKLEGIGGEASLDVQISNDNVQVVKNLNVQSKNLDLKNVVLNFKPKGKKTELSGGVIKNAKVGESIFDADFTVEDDVLHIKARGDVLDARPYLATGPQKTEGEVGQAIILSGNAKKMITADGHHIEAVEIFLDVDEQGDLNRIEMDAKAGKGVIYLRYKPDQHGVIKLELEADDAGATLQAFDVYDKVRGGKIIIRGNQMAGERQGDLEGEAVLKDFKVVDAPALAHLLSAMSLTGIGGLLENEGIGFSTLETDFKWMAQPGGRLITFKDGRTSGNALGLTFEGRIDNQEQKIKINGTIVPVSMVSDIIGSIPILGDLLTAGSGVFAATYEIKGDLKDPKTSVNPLSVLAPGILRKIFFED